MVLAMAVLIGGALGARIAYEQADDNSADRLLGLQAQVGIADEWVPNAGVVVARKLGSEIIDIDVGLNVYADGQTFGTGDNRLVSAGAPFTPTMVGLPLTIFGFGDRIVEVYGSATEIEYSGAAIAAGTGRRFTTPLGIAAFDDAVVDGNTITSASAPFYAELVGRNVGIGDLGTRKVTAFTSATEVDFDGAAVTPSMSGARVTVPVFMEEAERNLSALSGQVLDSHRVPATSSPMIMRWRMGERKRRGSQRTVV